MKETVVRLLSGFLVISLCGLLAACGTKPQISLFDLQEKMIAADTDLPEMSVANSSSENAGDLFSYISDMEYSKVEGFFVAYSKEGKADEIAVINVKDSGDVSEAKDSINKHIQKRLNLYKQYDPTQTGRVQKALVFTKGNFCVLIICDNSNKVKQAFSDFIIQ